MNQSNLSKWLKIISIGVGVAGVLTYFLIIPEIGRTWADQNPEFAYCFWPWLIFIWVTGIFCYIALFDFWKICNEIHNNNSFSEKNAKLLSKISCLAVVDSGIFFVGNIVFLLLSMSHPGILLASFLVDFAGIAIAVVSAALSHLVYKAADLKSESDLTI